jgi:hypothetical protein
MHGDFSRWTFRPSARYTRVLMQQGRLQVDSDWNEQAAIQDARLAALAADVIGPAGGPRGQAMHLQQRHALEFDGKAGYAYVRESGAFDFDERHPFAIGCAVRPEREGGPLLSRTDDDGLSAWRLEIDAEGRVAFSRVEIRGVDYDEVLVEDGYLGDVHVRLEVDTTVHEHVPVVRTLRTHRTLPTGVFSDVAVTFDGRALRVYIDGILAAVDASVGRAPRRRCALTLGGTAAADDAVLRGALSDVRIFAECAHISMIHRHHVEPPPALVGWWPMETGEHDTRHDCGHGTRHLVIVRGPDGYPRDRHDVWVEPGRYYVNGLLCEQATSAPLDTSMANRERAPNEEESSRHVLAVLDAWEQYVGVIQDPALADSALGGPDTAGRVRTAWRILCLPMDAEKQATPHDHTALEMVDGLRLEAASHGRLQARYESLGMTLDNALYRVEVHDGPLRSHQGRATTAKVGDVDVARQRVRLRHVEDHVWDWRVGQVVDVHCHRAGQFTQPSVRATVVDVDSHAHWLTLDPWPTAVGTATHVHLRRVATFKWSRDNGAVALPIRAIDAASGSVDVGTAGREELPLTIGDWVELRDDHLDLHERPGPMLQVTGLVSSAGHVVVSRVPSPAIDLERHPYLRKWDAGTAATAAVVPIALHTWTPLERGVEVAFAGDGLYFPGDYWLIASRTLADAIEWPLNGGHPAALRPLGPHHAFAPLARLALRDDRTDLHESYVRTFAPSPSAARLSVDE